MRIYHGTCSCGAIRYEGTDAPGEDARCVHCGTIPECGQEQDSKDTAPAKGCMVGIGATVLLGAAIALAAYGFYCLFRG